MSSTKHKKPVDLYNEQGSLRYTRFQSALKIAVQRAAYKWTFEDFEECFPLYAKEDKNGASATFKSIGEYVEAHVTRDLNKLFEEYDVRDSIDSLHAIIDEATKRKARGEKGKDVWREDVQPHQAVSARTVPRLQAEVLRLQERLAAMEADNTKLTATLQENVAATDSADKRSLELLKQIDEALEAWDQIPREDIQTWTIQTLESTAPSLRT